MIIDGVTTIHEDTIFPANLSNVQGIAGFINVSLSQGVHNINVEFKSSSVNNDSTISDIRIDLYQVG